MALGADWSVQLSVGLVSPDMLADKSNPYRIMDISELYYSTNIVSKVDGLLFRFDQCFGRMEIRQIVVSTCKVH